MTALWVFLGVVALELIVPLFRPHPSLIQCSDGPDGGECITRYSDAVLPTWLGLLLFAIALLVAARFLVRRWRIR